MRELNGDRLVNSKRQDFLGIDSLLIEHCQTANRKLIFLALYWYIANLVFGNTEFIFNSTICRPGDC